MAASVGRWLGRQCVAAGLQRPTVPTRYRPRMQQPCAAWRRGMLQRRLISGSASVASGQGGGSGGGDGESLRFEAAMQAAEAALAGLSPDHLAGQHCFVGTGQLRLPHVPPTTRNPSRLTLPVSLACPSSSSSSPPPHPATAQYFRDAEDEGSNRFVVCSLSRDLEAGTPDSGFAVAELADCALPAEYGLEALEALLKHRGAMSVQFGEVVGLLDAAGTARAGGLTGPHMACPGSHLNTKPLSSKDALDNAGWYFGYFPGPLATLFDVRKALVQVDRAQQRLRLLDGRELASTEVERVQLHLSDDWTRVRLQLELRADSAAATASGEACAVLVDEDMELDLEPASDDHSLVGIMTATEFWVKTAGSLALHTASRLQLPKV